MLALIALIVGTTAVAVVRIERAAREQASGEEPIVYGPLFLYGPLETADRD